MRQVWPSTHVNNFNCFWSSLHVSYFTSIASQRFIYTEDAPSGSFRHHEHPFAYRCPSSKFGVRLTADKIVDLKSASSVVKNKRLPFYFSKYFKRSQVSKRRLNLISFNYDAKLQCDYYTCSAVKSDSNHFYLSVIRAWSSGGDRLGIPRQAILITSRATALSLIIICLTEFFCQCACNLIHAVTAVVRNLFDSSPLQFVSLSLEIGGI